MALAVATMVRCGGVGDDKVNDKSTAAASGPGDVKKGNSWPLSIAGHAISCLIRPC
ncbi:hypothetical protein [Mucilaginibacter antarcticus]|uniref:hypothetical protein n=1 Tax=Mucilaginibacter antarcticus TaxID=1855725 RepID=UPI0036278B99